MEVTVAESGPCRKTLTIKVPPEKIRDHIDEVFKSASHQVSVKGFRPGRVPRKLLEQRFGAEIMAEAKEQLINSTFTEALREHKLQPLGEPELEGVDETPLDVDATLEYQVHVDVRPDVTVKETKGIEVKRGETEVTDADVAGALQQIADQKKTLQPVDEPAEETDFVKGKLVFKNEAGDAVAEREGVQLNTRIPIAGTDPEVFATKLKGAEIGQTLTMELTFPDNFEKEEARGQKGSVELTVDGVLRISPPAIDDELAKSYDFENLAALEAELRQRIGEEKERSNKARQEEEIIDALLAENSFDLPVSLLDDQTKRNLTLFEQRMKEAKLDEAEIAKKLEEAEPEARQDANRRVRAFFLLEAVASKEKIFVTENDVDEALRQIASENNASIEDVRKYYESREALADLRAGVMERKVREFLREKAKYTD